MRSLNRSTKIGVALTVVAVAAVVALWFTNTESLDFPFEVITQDVQPGDTVEIDLGDRSCAPNSVILYRPSGLGRWQETHVSGRRDIRRWYEISTRTYAEIAECRTADTWEVPIPDNIGWSRIAVCATDNDCAEINIGQ
jgi:hypothetical protein